MTAGRAVAFTSFFGDNAGARVVDKPSVHWLRFGQSD